MLLRVVVIKCPESGMFIRASVGTDIHLYTSFLLVGYVRNLDVVFDISLFMWKSNVYKLNWCQLKMTRHSMGKTYSLASKKVLYV